MAGDTATPGPDTARQDASAPSDLPPQRPAVMGMSTMMSVTASMLFICALGFAWLLAFAAQSALDYNDPSESGLYYLLERFHLRLELGLAWPLFGFPAVTVVLAFFLLARRQWARIAYAALGLVSCGWLVFTWHARWAVIAWPIGYIAFCVAITWLDSVTRWLRWSREGPG